MSAEIWKGAAERLDDFDLPEVAARIGCGEDEIHAVLEVETRGGGYDKLGRVKMLFEPHVFWRELGAGPARDRAQRLGLAYPKWGEKPYPADSYPRLTEAMKIAPVAALRSCSWGLGQIMGFNHSSAGYQSAQGMAAHFAQSERAQLEAMVAFIEASGLDDEMRRHDWAGFARGYNGAGYAKHGYHTKLAAAFAKWAKIKDTPARPAPAPVAAPAPVSAPIRTAEAIAPVAPAPAPAVTVREVAAASVGAPQIGWLAALVQIFTPSRKG